MGLQQAGLDVQQKVRQGKVLLARLTPNKRAEARNLEVSDTTVGRWCDVSQVDANMPWQLLSLHSAADELLGLLAQEVGKTVVDLVDLGDLNGDVIDERDKLIVLLGQETEKLMQMHSDRRSPGRIDLGEAHKLLPLVRKIVRVAATMEAELTAIAGGDW